VSQLAPAFAVWLGLVTSTWPRAHPVLYLRGRISDTAVPPYISGRTSYLQVRLEFLRYPQLIPQICNSGGFGPRRGVTPASPWSWVDHLVSGRIPATISPYSDSLSLRLWLVIGPSPGHGDALAGSFYKRHAIRREASFHRPLTACGYMVSGSLDTPLDGGLFTFPSRYSYAIGRHGYSSLGGWSPLLPTGFLESRGTQAHGGRQRAFRYGTLTLCGRPFQGRLRCVLLSHSHGAGPTTPPTVARRWFGLVRVRSPLLTESRLISVPRGTEMFQFPRCPSTRLWIQRGIRGYGPRGLPHSETHGSSLARSSPCTFRRDPRPSSVRDA
jgi:hypothetical protein